MSKVIVETSARHVHLTEEHIKILFGEGATLTKKKDLSQPASLRAKKELLLSVLRSPFPAYQSSVPQEALLRLKFLLQTLVLSA